MTRDQLRRAMQNEQTFVALNDLLTATQQENAALKRQLASLLAGSGIPCPDCGGPTVSLRTFNVRRCIDCGVDHPWNLSPGQKPLLGSNRQDRTSKG